MKRDSRISAIERCVATLLDNVVPGTERHDASIRRTPKRVAKSWTKQLLDGYGKSPSAALGNLITAPRGPRCMTVVTDLYFRSMCPHHLLPYTGRAHIAYIPHKHIVGFGRLGALLDCFAHRLILQEELARCVVLTLHDTLGCVGTACIIEAEQGCLRLLDGHQRDATTHTEAYEGILRTDGPFHRELWARIYSQRSPF